MLRQRPVRLLVSRSVLLTCTSSVTRCRSLLNCLTTGQGLAGCKPAMQRDINCDHAASTADHELGLTYALPAVETYSRRRQKWIEGKA